MKPNLFLIIPHRIFCGTDTESLEGLLWKVEAGTGLVHFQDFFIRCPLTPDGKYLFFDHYARPFVQLACITHQSQFLSTKNLFRTDFFQGISKWTASVWIAVQFFAIGMVVLHAVSTSVGEAILKAIPQRYQREDWFSRDTTHFCRGCKDRCIVYGLRLWTRITLSTIPMGVMSLEKISLRKPVVPSNGATRVRTLKNSGFCPSGDVRKPFLPSAQKPQVEQYHRCFGLSSGHNAGPIRPWNQSRDVSGISPTPPCWD